MTSLIQFKFPFMMLLVLNTFLFLLFSFLISWLVLFQIDDNKNKKKKKNYYYDENDEEEEEYYYEEEEENDDDEDDERMNRRYEFLDATKIFQGSCVSYYPFGNNSIKSTTTPGIRNHHCYFPLSNCPNSEEDFFDESEGNEFELWNIIVKSGLAIKTFYYNHDINNNDETPNGKYELLILLKGVMENEFPKSDVLCEDYKRRYGEILKEELLRLFREV